MKPRHPIAGLESRPTHASEARRQLVTCLAAFLVCALLVIGALILATRVPTP